MPLGPSIRDDELKRFSGAYPWIFEHLKLNEFAATPRIFSSGMVLVPRHSSYIIGGGYDAYHTALARHLAGDFGDIGRFEPSRLDDPAVVWAIGLHDQATQNAYAVRQQRGLIESQYPHGDKAVIVVKTVLAARHDRSRTLITVVPTTTA